MLKSGFRVTEVAEDFQVLKNNAPASFSQSEYPFSSSECVRKKREQITEVWIITLYTIPVGKGRWEKKYASCVYVIIFLSSLRLWTWLFSLTVLPCLTLFEKCL